MLNKTQNAMQNRQSNALLGIFIFSLLIVFSPFKLLAYLTPFFALFYYIIKTDNGKTVIKFIALTLIYVIVVVFWWLTSFFVDERFILSNSLIAFITYGSFVFVFSLDSVEITISAQQKFIKIIKNIIILEATVGIFQILIYGVFMGKGFDSASGDIVQGTIGLFSFLNPGIDFNNPIYCVNLAILIIFYLPHVFTSKKDYWVVILGCLALLMASVVHLIFSLVFAFAVITVFFYINQLSQKTIYTVIGTGILAIITTSLFYVVQPKNFELVSHYYEKFQNTETPKKQVTQRVFSELANESPQIWLGLGTGQFTSRASLMGTGRYFGDFKNPKAVLPLTEPNMSSYFEKYVFDLWNLYVSNPQTFGGSSMTKPFYSIISVVVEFGFILSIIFVVLFITYLTRLQSYFGNKNNPIIYRYYAFSCAIITLFLFLISLIENYLEITQAIFLGILLIMVFNPLQKNNVPNIENNQNNMNENTDN